MEINFSRVIDLSHTISEGMPVWPGDPEVVLQTRGTNEQEGWYLQSMLIGEHTGTHFGAPAHSIAGGRTADAFGADELVRKAVCIDATELAGGDPDFRLLSGHVMAWEKSTGVSIPNAGVVLMRTGRSDLWHDAGSYFGLDQNGGMHFPAFDPDCARFLAEERGVAGLGIDAAGVDPGNDPGFAVNRLWLSDPGRFHLENLTNLHLLPRGPFTLVIGMLRIASSSGAPARVLVLV